MLKVFALVLFTSTFFGKSIENNEDTLQKIKQGFSEFSRTGHRPWYLDDALRNYQIPHIFRYINKDFASKGISVCPLCSSAIQFLINEIRKGKSNEELAKEASIICELLNIEDKRVCEGTIKNNVGIFSYIINKNPEVDGDTFCGLLLQGQNCAKDGDFEWTIDIPEGQTLDKPKSLSSESFAILQISDIHYDPLYSANKSNTCGEPLCCQIDQIDGDVSEGTACGYWSDYKAADTPIHTVNEVLRQVQSHNFDYVYYTGDIVSHRVWSTSVANNTRDIKEIFGKFREVFKKPVFPILGNHEPNPLNVYASINITEDSLSTQWLFDVIAEEWSQWLPEEAKETILKGGYYTVSPRQGFRIIVLNSNVAYTLNWWLISNNYDPYGQLTWLVKTLKQAEENKESVHILSHIPTGSGECLKVWSREYNRIVERFANTITGQFNGHTHSDEFYVYYNKSQPDQAINVAWNGASVTTYIENNPSYKLYQIDNTTFNVLDQEEWTFNLTKANANGAKTPDWYKLYSFKDAYGVGSLEPSEIDDLVHRMAQNHSLLIQYHNFRYRNGDNAVRSGCDETCQKHYLCEVSTAEYGQTTQCESLKKLYDKSK